MFCVFLVKKKKAAVQNPRQFMLYKYGRKEGKKEKPKKRDKRVGKSLGKPGLPSGSCLIRSISSISYEI
jgi:hypothetical protein